MLESEYGIIGCVLYDNENLNHVMNIIRPEMFTNEFCESCYIGMRSIYNRGIEVNIISLSQEVENGKWSRDYVLQELKKCMEKVAISTNIKTYSEIFLKDYKSRKLSVLFENLSLLPADVDKTIGELLSRLEELRNNKERTHKKLSEIVEMYKGNYFNVDVGKIGVKTGFAQLDECIGTLENGDVTIIGARPAVGKSAFATQMIAQMAEKGAKIAYFNLEMNESQVYERFISRLSKISLKRVRRANAFLGEEESAFNKANDTIAKYDVTVYTGSKTIGEIKADCRYQNYDIIVIDYLQLIKADRMYSNRASEVGEISKGIKEIATMLKTHVIALSQLNRVSEQRDTKEPTMSELRESGDIEQDASNIFLMWNLSDDKKYKGFKAEKQRQGELIKIGMTFIGERMEFVESTKMFSDFLKEAKSNDGFERCEHPLDW